MTKKMLLLSILICLASCSKSPQDKSADLSGQAFTAIDTYDFKTAEATLTKISEAEPASTVPLYGRALILQRKLLLYDALRDYVTLIEINPNDSEALRQSVRILIDLGHFDIAVNLATRLRDLLPSDPLARLTLADALILNAQYQLAIQAIAEAKEIGLVKSVADMAIARSYLGKHQFDSARTMASGALENPTDQTVFYEQAANYFETLGLSDSAAVLSRKAADLGANHDARLAHFRRLLRLGYFSDARQVMQGIREQGSTGPTSSALKIIYSLAMGDANGARRAGDVYSSQTGLTLTGLFYEMKYMAAYGDMQTVDQNGIAIIAMLERDKPIQMFSDLLKFDVIAFQSYYSAPLASLKLLDEAPGSYQGRKEIVLQRLHLLSSTGQPDAFEDGYERVMKFHESEAEWLTGLAKVCTHPSVRMDERAESLYRQALGKDRWNKPALQQLAAFLAKRDRFDDLFALLDSHKHLADQFADIPILTAQYLVQSGRFDKGLSQLEVSIAAASRDMRPYRTLATELTQWGNPEHLGRLASIVEKHSEGDVALMTLAAELRLKSGEFDAALKLAERAMEIDSTYLAAAGQKARALYDLGRSEQALKLFESIYKKDRFNAANNLQWSRTLANEKTDMDRAANLARQTVFETQGSLEALLNLSYVYYQSGRYDLSRGEALIASRKFRDSPQPLYRLGMAMHEEGKAEAADTLQKAIDKGLRGEALTIATKIVSSD